MRNAWIRSAEFFFVKLNVRLRSCWPRRNNTRGCKSREGADSSIDISNVSSGREFKFDTIGGSQKEISRREPLSKTCLITDDRYTSHVRTIGACHIQVRPPIKSLGP